MIISEIRHSASPIKSRPYPKLVISKCSNKIVIAIKDSSSDSTCFEGFLVKVAAPFKEGVGYYSNDWTKSFFEDFEKELVLKND